MRSSFSRQRGFLRAMLLVWLLAFIGWALNIYQVVAQIPATFGDITPMFAFKVISILIAPVGSVLGYIGLF